MVFLGFLTVADIKGDVGATHGSGSLGVGSGVIWPSCSADL
jgi:hypothetical protein